MRTSSAETMAVANTSNTPSTQRCTTHQRQYSMIEMWVLRAVEQPGAEQEADRYGRDHHEEQQRTGLRFLRAPA